MAKTIATLGISSAFRLIAMLLLSLGGMFRIGPVAAESPPPAGANPGTENCGLLADPPEGGPIQIWWGLGGPLGRAFEKQVARFNESQKKTVVEVRMLPGYEGVHGELRKAFQTGDLPDAAIVEIHQIASFAAGKSIQPLDDFIKDDPTFDAEDLLVGMLTNLRYDDKLYALPMNRSTPILYYNKKRFAEVGLNPNKPPETWQHVREMSRALTSEDGIQYGFIPARFSWMFESLVWSAGGELISGKKATFAEPGAKAAQVWADMVHRDKTARIGRSAFSEFAQGRAAMIVESTALLQSLTEESEFEIGTAILPRLEGFKNAVPTGGGAAVIPAAISAERKAAVWTFLTWFISTTQAADWSRATGYVPVRQSARILLRTEGFYKEHPGFETAIEQLKFAREAPLLPQWPAAYSIIGEAMNSIVGNDAPARETLKAAEMKVDALLSSDSKPKP